jgi:hypothetical protein
MRYTHIVKEPLSFFRVFSEIAIGYGLESEEEHDNKAINNLLIIN